MNLIKNIIIILLLSMSIISLESCGIYSFTGAKIDGKTLRMQTLENKALNAVPTLSPVLTEKIRSRILTQTGLAPVSDLDADYIIEGNITAYNVSISGLSNQQNALASQNRLTITVEIEFINKKDTKANFKKSFSRFADFPATAQLQSVETNLIEDIATQLADDIFNKAFVNW